MKSHQLLSCKNVFRKSYAKKNREGGRSNRVKELLGQLSISRLCLLELMKLNKNILQNFEISRGFNFAVEGFLRHLAWI